MSPNLKTYLKMTSWDLMLSLLSGFLLLQYSVVCTVDVESFTVLSPCYILIYMY